MYGHKGTVFYLQLKSIDSECSLQTNVICCYEDFNDLLVMRKSVLVRFPLLNTFIAFNSNITFFLLTNHE